MKLTLLALGTLTTFAFSMEALSAGNSGSTGKPMSNRPPISREADTSMDDHSNSALGRQDIQAYEEAERRPASRTSLNKAPTREDLGQSSDEYFDKTRSLQE